MGKTNQPSQPRDGLRKRDKAKENDAVAEADKEQTKSHPPAPSTAVPEKQPTKSTTESSSTNDTPTLSWNSVDWLLILLFLGAALVTRFHQIEVPQGIVWDEAHFTKFLTWYFTGHYFVDIHPPLAKMVHALALHYFTDFVGAQEIQVEWWTDHGFVGTKDWELLYEDDHGKPYIVIRMVSAVVGVLLVLVTYFTVRAMGCGKLSSIVGTTLILFENLILLQSRLILTDVFLYFFNMASYGASFYSVREESQKNSFFWVFMTGAMLGGALSIKYTALGTVGLVGVHQAWFLFSQFFNDKSKNRVRKLITTGVWKALTILSVATAIFFGLWILHIYVLPYDGQGTGFMNEEFKQTLAPKLGPDQQNVPAHSCPRHANAWSDCGFGGISRVECEKRGCCYDPTSPRNWCYHKGDLQRPHMSMVAKIREVLRATWANNEGQDLMIHPHMSEWYEWPILNCRQVPFGFVGTKGKIISLGNPAVWWGVFAIFGLSLLAGVTAFLFSLGQMSAGQPLTISTYWSGIFVTLWLGYVGNIVPYILIPRSKFVYHYIPALEVGCLLWAACVEFFVRWAKSRGGFLATTTAFLAVALSIATVTAAFVYWAPWVYGWELERKEHQQRRWIHKWGHGFM